MLPPAWRDEARGDLARIVSYIAERVAVDHVEIVAVVHARHEYP